jgi:hypothetical protein
MEREHLKVMIEKTRPDTVRAEMYSDPLMRRMKKVNQDANDGYHEDLLALYSDRSLTEQQLRAGSAKAHARWENALKKLVPLEERFEREVRIPGIINSGLLKKSAAAALRKRFGTAAPKRIKSRA